METMKTALRGLPIDSRLVGPGQVCRHGGPLRISCIATPTKPPAARLAKRSKVEIIKQESDYLRHPLMEELVSEAPSIGEPAMQLMKFHGSYQQDHRDKRAFGQGKWYQFMMRTKQPAGIVNNQLYLTMDDLADQVEIVVPFSVHCPE